MDSKKRKAELQLTSEDAVEIGTNEPDKSSSESNGETKEIKEDTPAPAFSGGFSSYAKTNPFAAALSSKPGFGFGASTASAPSPATKGPPPPLTLPSPKSPKANPFSSPSPAHNPFVTIVENETALWKQMADDNLTAEEAAKSSSLGDGKGFRTSFFGGRSASKINSFGSVASSGNNIFGFATGSDVVTPSSSESKLMFGEKSTDKHNTTGEADEGDDDDDNDENNSENADEDNANNTTGNASPSNAANMKIINLPENVKLVTGEEDDECLLQFRAKLYRYSTSKAEEEAEKRAVKAAVAAAIAKGAAAGPNDVSGPAEGAPTDVAALLSNISKESASNGTKEKAIVGEWLEVGVGPLKLLMSKGSDTSNDKMTRLVMRREDKQGGVGTKLILNARLNQYVTVVKQGDKMIRLVCPNFVEGEAGHNNAAAGSATKLGTFMIKTKTNEEAEDLHMLINDFSGNSQQQ